MTDLVKRHSQNPLISPSDISPSRPEMEVVCVMNPGAFIYGGKIWLLMRVAERPLQEEGKITFCIYDEKGDLKIVYYLQNQLKNLLNIH